MLENAQTEAPEVDNTQNFSEEYMIHLASDICDEMMERSSGPLIHKIVALTILKRLENWHQHTGLGRLDEGESSGVGWLKDAGLLQSAALLLESVSLGPEDFTCNGEI